jgi:hypothetical protein
MGDAAEMRPKIPAVVPANAALAFPLPLAGEGAEQSEAGGGSLRESQCRESPERAPTPTLPRKRGRGGGAPSVGLQFHVVLQSAASG